MVPGSSKFEARRSLVHKIKTSYNQKSKSYEHNLKLDKSTIMAAEAKMFVDFSYIII